MGSPRGICDDRDGLALPPTVLGKRIYNDHCFLEQRFDRTTRQMVAALFLFMYITVLLPVVLYTGSLAIKTMFGWHQIPLWTIVIGIGALGSWYAIFGGLKSVAVSDTFNGIGLLIGGLAVPALALAALGDGSMSAGLSTLVSDKPESLAVLASIDRSGEMASVPWDTLLTGMMFIQIFYWSTNQVVVQRAMGAKNLAEGQKGVLFASVMKLVSTHALHSGHYCSAYDGGPVCRSRFRRLENSPRSGPGDPQHD